MTPKASAKAICCSTVLSALTRSTACAWALESAETPQHWVNWRVPLPLGPGGQLDGLVLQVGVVVLDGALDPVALDGHRGLLRAEGLATPPGVELVGHLEVAGLDVASGPTPGPRSPPGCSPAPADASSLSHQPPFWTTKAPSRSMPTPMPRPGLVLGGELLRDGLELLPGRRDVGVGQAGLRPRVGVDLQGEGREVLGDAVLLALVGEGLAQRLVEVVVVLDLVGVGVEAARSWRSRRSSAASM